VFCGLVFVFLVLPNLVVLPLSFTSGIDFVYPMPGFSMRWYEEFFTRPDWLDSLRHSLYVGAWSTALATVLGTSAALGIDRLQGGMRRLVSALFVLPMAVPIVITGVAMFFLYAGVGLANTFTGLIIAHATRALPFVVVCVMATLQGLDMNLVRAGSNLGGTPVRVFYHVVLPLILPGVLTGALFAFAFSFDDIVIVLFVAGPEQRTLPVQMFSGIRFNISPTILAAASMLLVLSAAMMVAAGALTRRTERLRGEAVRAPQ
jgi:putative spermidine/putrescine transport system permease protein